MDDRDIRIFEIIYNKCGSNKPMSYIKREVAEAQKALLDVSEEIKGYQPRPFEPVEEDFPTRGEIEDGDEQFSGRLTREDLVIKNPKKIRESIAEDSITCCICGEKFKSLGAHLKRTHNISAEEYISLCGMPEGTVLMSREYYRKAQTYARNAYDARKKETAEPMPDENYIEDVSVDDFDPDVEIEMEPEGDTEEKKTEEISF